jgi:hypothetical protein
MLEFTIVGSSVAQWVRHRFHIMGSLTSSPRWFESYSYRCDCVRKFFFQLTCGRSVVYPKTHCIIYLGSLPPIKKTDLRHITETFLNDKSMPFFIWYHLMLSGIKGPEMYINTINQHLFQTLNPMDHKRHNIQIHTLARYVWGNGQIFTCTRFSWPFVTSLTYLFV